MLSVLLPVHCKSQASLAVFLNPQPLPALHYFFGLPDTDGTQSEREAQFDSVLLP